MVKKTTGVDGAPQEEVAKKPVKKTRQTKKASGESPSPKKRTPRKKKETKEDAVVQAEQTVDTPPVVTEEHTVKDAPVAPDVEESSEPDKEKVAEKAEKKPEQAPAKAEKKPENAPAKVEETQEKAPAKAEKAPEAPEAKEPQQPKPQPQVKPIPPLPNIVINDIMELANAPKAQICLSDQQVQMLSLEEAERRFQYLEYTLANILDYDIVISDTNIWLELLVGHTSSHSDPRVNARLQFERQLEFISRLMKHRGGRFMMMSETYEEIDRFATAQEPTNYRDADWSDEALCRNVAARLAKRLILSQQRENRLRIECIGAESHHGAFADPAIIRRTVELFSQGRKILLLTNDASVAIRSMGMCDDLQRHNKIDDRTWDEVYAPLRPMVFTMDDLKVLDNYTRQYHFMQMAAGKTWMQDIPKIPVSRDAKPVSPVYGGKQPPKRENLELWMEGFRPGDRHEHRSDQQARQKEQQQKREAEKQRQEEAARQKEEQRRLQSERDRARQLEINRQKELEKQKQLEAQRQAEQQRQAEAAKQAEAQRQAEAKRQQAEAAKQAEAQKQLDPEAEKQAELEAKQKAEAKRLEIQKKAEAKKLELQRKAEAKRKAEQKAAQAAQKQEKSDAPKQQDASNDAPKAVVEAPKAEPSTADSAQNPQSAEPATDRQADEQPKKRPARRGGSGRGRAKK